MRIIISGVISFVSKFFLVFGNINQIIDNFKHFNDTYGHNCGDLVLKEVAQIIQQLIRPTDIAARYGGEEFCIMLPNTTPKQAKLIAERIRSKVESTVTEYENFKLSVTISLGVACYDQNLDISAKYLIDRADKALYRSKQEGKNRVSVWE